MPKQARTKKDFNNPNYWSVAISLLAFLVSIIALIQSFQANDIAREDLATYKTEVASANIPRLKFSYYPAISTNLYADVDSRHFQRLGVQARPLPTEYWRTQMVSSRVTNSTRYLFIVIANEGPGTVASFEFKASWQPKEGQTPPSGLLAIEGPILDLPAGQAYGILVDVLESYDEGLDLKSQSSTHFNSIKIEITYQDINGHVYPNTSVELLGLSLETWSQP